MFRNSGSIEWIANLRRAIIPTTRGRLDSWKRGSSTSLAKAAYASPFAFALTFAGGRQPCLLGPEQKEQVILGCSPGPRWSMTRVPSAAQGARPRSSIT